MEAIQMFGKGDPALIGFLTIAIVAILMFVLAREGSSETNEGRFSGPVVVLAYDGTGDFGPETPGTETAGWQEAIDYCVDNNHDLYVKGGWGGRVPIYHIRNTITIPPTQDFKIDGGVYVLNWTGPREKDLLVIDSGMDCHCTFGILVYGGVGAALRIKPSNPVPIDKMVVFVDSSIRTSSIADPHPFDRGVREGGAGIIFDTGAGGIYHNDFHFTAVLNFATCVESPGPGHGFAYNRVECNHLHTNADKSTLLKLGEKSDQNIVNVKVGVDQGAENVRGIDLFGSHNVLEIVTRGGGFAPEGTLIFEESAEGNQVNILTRKDHPDISSIITDLASEPTNQVTWTGPPPPIRRVKAKSGVFEYTQRLYPVTVRITGGTVSDVKLVRGSDSISYGSSAGSEIFMSVGDKLRIESTVAPTLQVVPLKVK